MRSRVISLMVAVSLLAGIAQAPWPAAASKRPVNSAERSHHHCCPKAAETQAPALAPLFPTLPCGPGHSCCVVRTPAKLPSLPAGSGDKDDRQLVRKTAVDRNLSQPVFATAIVALAPTRCVLELNSILRI